MAATDDDKEAVQSPAVPLPLKYRDGEENDAPDDLPTLTDATSEDVMLVEPAIEEAVDDDLPELSDDTKEVNEDVVLSSPVEDVTLTDALDGELPADASLPELDLPALNEAIEALADFPSLDTPIQPQVMFTQAQVNILTAEAAQRARADVLPELEARLARNIDDWIERELPRLVSVELEGLAERVRARAAERMRTELLPVVLNSLRQL